jgi:hypothetical protein
MCKPIKFYALVDQEIQGCDYSIACGVNFIEIKNVSTMGEAYERFNEMAFNHNYEGDDALCYSNEHAISIAKIISVSEEVELDVAAQYRRQQELDVAALYRRQQEIKNFEQGKTTEETERAEYERLKRKFN